MALPDADLLSTYLGAARLLDFSAVVDPNTDVSAKGMEQAMCSLAMGTRMFARAIVVFIDNGPTVPVTFHEAVWGNGFSVLPAVENTGTGLYRITWPTSVTDQLSIAHDVNLRAVLSCNVMSVSGFFLSSATVASSNTVTVRTANTSGALTNTTSQPVVVVVL